MSTSMYSIESIMHDAARMLGVDNYINIDIALHIYKRYTTVKSVRKRSRRLLAYTALYLSLRIECIPVTINRFSKVLDVNVRSLSSCYRSMIRELGIMLPSIDIERYVAYILESLDLSERVRHDALYIAKSLKARNLVNGKNPAGMAAAAVCLAVSRHTNACRYVRSIASLVGISMVTLRKRMNELATML